MDGRVGGGEVLNLLDEGFGGGDEGLGGVGGGLRQIYDDPEVLQDRRFCPCLVRAYRHLETYARDTGAGMLLIQLQPPFSIIQDDLRCGRTKMTR